MKVRCTAGAQADRLSINEYLEARSQVGQRNVLTRILDTVDLIAEQPYPGRRTDVGDIRVRVVRRYPYRIFYRIVSETVVILQIRHDARSRSEFE